MPEHKNEYSSPEMMINVSDLLKKDSHGNMCIPYQVDIRLFNGKELKAFAKVTYGHIVINDICILQRFGRITIVYPSKRLNKRNGKDVFVSVAFPNSPEASKELNRGIMQAYKIACQKDTDERISSIPQAA